MLLVADVEQTDLSKQMEAENWQNSEMFNICEYLGHVLCTQNNRKEEIHSTSPGSGEKILEIPQQFLDMTVEDLFWSLD